MNSLKYSEILTTKNSESSIETLTIFKVIKGLMNRPRDHFLNCSCENQKAKDHDLRVKICRLPFISSRTV